jgi:hypothetical protein
MMKRSRSWPASRQNSIAAGPDADDDLYAAALTSLLAQAVRPPGTLDRLKRTIWSALKALHARRRADGDRLPPEYWHMFW